MKRPILIAMLVVVFVFLTGCVTQQPPKPQPVESRAQIQAEESVKAPTFETAIQQQETILPEKIHHLKSKAPSKAAPASQATNVKAVEEKEQFPAEPVIESSLPPEQPTTILEEAVTEAYSAPTTVQEGPVPVEDPTPFYSENGWHPKSDTCYHGDGTDSGVCPCCGLIYGPAGGIDTWTGEDGVMG